MVAIPSIKTLQKMELFNGLNDEELREVGVLCSEHSHEPGELFVIEGNSVDYVYFVKKGRVAVEIHILGSPEDGIVIDTLGEGEVFAWSALVTRTLTASIRVVEPTEVLDVNAAALLDICEKQPRIGHIIMKNLTLVIDSRLTQSRAKLSTAYADLKTSQEQLVQAEKLSSLGQMAASIAHEINNPLAGVLNYTKLLIKKLTDGNIAQETALNYLAKMDSELSRSTRLVKNLLDFARQSMPLFRELNANDIVNRALDIAANSVELQNIRVVTELNPVLPALMADFDQLTQVCTNLVINAIQAMPQGGKLLLRTSADGDQIKIEVKDTGCGIPQENMGKLFTPFFTTKREVKGVGLGLAVSYGIVQRHHGRIELQSKVGEGTTFIVCLPLHREKSQG